MRARFPPADAVQIARHFEIGDPATRRLVACVGDWRVGVGARAAAMHDQAILGADTLMVFQDILP